MEQKFRQHLADLLVSTVGVGSVLLLTFGCGSSGEDIAGDVDTNGSASRNLISATSTNYFVLPIEDGVDDPLTLANFSIENGSLVVRLDAAYEGIEPVGDLILITDKSEITGRKVIHDNNDVDAIFDGINEIAGTVILDRVNQTKNVDIEVKLGDGVFVLPDGVKAMFSVDKLIESREDVRLPYSSVTPTLTVIDLATVSADGATFSTKGIAATYAASGAVRNPVIIFPIGAKSLLENPNALLTITKVMQMVRYEIALDGR